MLLGIFSATDVLPLDFKAAYSDGDLLTQRLGELEQEAERDERRSTNYSTKLSKLHKVASVWAA
jgi:hypothetical protein